MMDCVHCGGELARATAPLHIDRAGVHLLMESVPAWVCSQCGEPVFDEAAVDAVQTILATADSEQQKLEKIA